mgnify:CR=1 FL=1
MMKIPCAALLFILASTVLADGALRAFSSDGCSSFPDGTPSQKTLWRDCCVNHDLAYWLGGSYRARMQADTKLQQCVKALGRPTVATIMLAGVRAGGSPFWLTDYRWGYGWPYWQNGWPRGYRELTPAEAAYAQKMLLQNLSEIAPPK